MQARVVLGRELLSVVPEVRRMWNGGEAMTTNEQVRAALEMALHRLFKMGGHLRNGAVTLEEADAERAEVERDVENALAALSAATEGEREEDRHEVSVTRQGVTIKVLAGDFDFAVDLSKRIDSFLVMPATPPPAPKETPPPPDAARVESDVDGYCDPPAGPVPTREEARSKELLAALRDEKMKHAQVADYWAKQFAARDAEIATLRAQVAEAERSIEFLAATAENRARDIDHEKSRADAAEAKAKVAVRERDEALDALRDACEDRTDAERRIAEAVEFVAERVRETERQTERPTTWDALTYWETRQREAEMILRQLSDLTSAGTEKK